MANNEDIHRHFEPIQFDAFSNPLELRANPNDLANDINNHLNITSAINRLENSSKPSQSNLVSNLSASRETIHNAEAQNKAANTKPTNGFFSDTSAISNVRLINPDDHSGAKSGRADSVIFMDVASPSSSAFASPPSSNFTTLPAHDDDNSARLSLKKNKSTDKFLNNSSFNGKKENFADKSAKSDGTPIFKLSQGIRKLFKLT